MGLTLLSNRGKTRNSPSTFIYHPDPNCLNPIADREGRAASFLLNVFAQGGMIHPRTEQPLIGGTPGSALPDTSSREGSFTERKTFGTS